MKRIISKITVLILCLFAVMMCGVGCGEPEEEPRYISHIKIYDDYGYVATLWGYGDRDEFYGSAEYEYDEEKVYHLFIFEIYDNRDNKLRTYRKRPDIEGSDTRKHWIINEQVDADIDLVWIQFYITIGERPLITPEAYFDPNGATIEGEGDDIRYVYKYDGYVHAPIIKARYNGVDIEANSTNYGVRSIAFNGGSYPYGYPREIGIYEVFYGIPAFQYVNESDQENFYGVYATIIVEIRE